MARFSAVVRMASRTTSRGVLEIAGWLKESFELGPEWFGGGS